MSNMMVSIQLIIIMSLSFKLFIYLFIYFSTLEYNNIKVEEAVGFLLRARISQRPIEMRTPDSNLLGQQQNIQVPQLPSITGQPISTNINPISLNNVNFAALANLLGSLQQQQQQSAPASVPTQGIQPIPMIPPA